MAAVRLPRTRSSRRCAPAGSAQSAESAQPADAADAAAADAADAADRAPGQGALACGSGRRRRLRAPRRAERLETTLMELVHAVASVTDDPREMLATVRSLLEAGRVRLSRPPRRPAPEQA